MRKGCKKYFNKISEYLDGELDEALCQKIERHLQDCPECRDCLDSFKRSIKLCKEVAKEKMPPDIRNRLRSKLRECFNQKKNSPTL